MFAEVRKHAVWSTYIGLFIKAFVLRNLNLEVLVLSQVVWLLLSSSDSPNIYSFLNVNILGCSSDSDPLASSLFARSHSSLDEPYISVYQDLLLVDL